MLAAAISALLSLTGPADAGAVGALSLPAEGFRAVESGGRVEGVYTAGWGSNRCSHCMAATPQRALSAEHAEEGKNAHAVSALCRRWQRQRALATWPEQMVRLLSPNGTVLAHWTLPVANIWEVAVTSEGKRYAACDGGVLYALSDDEKTPIHVACRVPDRHIDALAADAHGNLYFGTSPRGLIYRLSADGDT